MENFNVLPPINPPSVGDIQGYVSGNSVTLKNLIQWENKRGEAVFCHQEVIESKWTPNYRVEVQSLRGRDWDLRTPIMHSALAGLDATDAGFDEAYIRALNALSTLTSARRGEISPTGRNFIMRACRRQYAPGALLLRAAILWALLGLEGNGQERMHSWIITGDVQTTTRVDDTEILNGVLVETSREGTDVIYTRLHSADEAFMIDVMTALASSQPPTSRAGEFGISYLWPKMNRPRVIFNASTAVGRPGGRISQASVWYAMERYCTIWDCHDLWQYCINTVQTMLLRPVDAGVLAGTKVIRLYWPESDLRAGAIGPFMAGISPEGMRTEPIPEPGWSAFLYGSAVKGGIFTASLYEVLRDQHDSHPAALAMGVASGAVMNKLLYAHGNYALMTGMVKERMKTAGWDFMSPGLDCIGIGSSKKLLRTVLNNAAVPWWTTLARHVPLEKQQATEQWLSPAIVTGRPKVNEWYLYRHLGATTERHVAAALCWLKARVRYRIETRDGNLRMMDVQPLKPDRFPPVLNPSYKNGGLAADAVIMLDIDAYSRIPLVEELARADVHVIPVLMDNTWVPENTRDDGLLEGPGLTRAPPPENPELYEDLDEFEMLLQDPTFDRQVGEGDPEEEKRDPAREEDRLRDRLAEVVGKYSIPMGGIARAEVRRIAPSQLTSDSGPIRSLPAAIAGIADDAVGWLQKVPPNERINAVRGILEICSLASPYTLATSEKKAMFSGRDKLIGLLRVLHQDTAMSIDELGGAPDKAIAKVAAEDFSVNLSRGIPLRDYLKDAVERSLAKAPGEAPDEPARDAETVEDFGRGTLHQGSVQGPSRTARAADVPPVLSGTLGFTLPDTSSASQKKPEE